MITFDTFFEKCFFTHFWQIFFCKSYETLFSIKIFLTIFFLFFVRNSLGQIIFSRIFLNTIFLLKFIFSRTWVIFCQSFWQNFLTDFLTEVFLMDMFFILNVDQTQIHITTPSKREMELSLPPDTPGVPYCFFGNPK